MTGAPPISIGMPVHNGAPYLEVALSSLLAQTFADFELLISDNASEDDTEEVCRAVARCDPRVTYLRQTENIGAAANYNLVFRRTSGEFFRWASHDDLVAPTNLERCLERFRSAGPGVVLVYPRTMLIDAEGREVGPYDDRLEMGEPTARQRLVTLARNWNLCNPVMGLMRRTAAERTRLIDTFPTSDLVFLAELALQGRVLEVPERLFLRRIHEGSAMQGSTTTDAAAWLDPNRARAGRPRSSSSTLPVLGEILRTVHRWDLPHREALAIEVSVTAAWLERRLRVRGGRLKQRLRGDR